MSKANRIMLYDADFTDGARSFYRENPTTNAIFSIGTIAGLKSAFALYSAVSYLIFNTHGRPGEMALGDKTTELDGFTIGLMLSAEKSFLS